MAKGKKGVLSFVLAVAILLTLVLGSGTTVFAQGTQGEVEPVAEAEAEIAEIAEEAEVEAAAEAGTGDEPEAEVEATAETEDEVEAAAETEDEDEQAPLTGSITGFETVELAVELGTAEEDIEFPGEVTATVQPEGEDAEAATITVNVAGWHIAKGEYNPDLTGFYHFQADIDEDALPEGVTVALDEDGDVAAPLANVKLGEVEEPELTPLAEDASTTETLNFYTRGDVELIGSGGGTLVWNKNDKILTLTNFVHVTSNSWIMGVPDGTEIKLVGNNSLTGGDDIDYACVGITLPEPSTATLTISSETGGTLKIQTGNAYSDSNYALYGAAGTNFILESGTVEAVAGAGTGTYNVGVQYANITINGGTLKATGAKQGIRYFNTLTVNGGKVEATANGGQAITTNAGSAPTINAAYAATGGASSSDAGALTFVSTRYQDSSNVDAKYVKIAEVPAAFALYFGDGDEGWSLYTDSGLNTKYTGNSGKWSAADGKLTLSGGFNFITTQAKALNLMADTEIAVTGTNGISCSYSTPMSTSSVAVYGYSTTYGWKSLSITGSGTLLLENDESTSINYVVTATNITVDGATLKATGTKGNQSVGVNAVSALTAKNGGTVEGVGGDINAVGDGTLFSRGIYAASISVTGTGSSVSGTGDDTTSEAACGIYVTNAPTGVTATGTTDGSTTSPVAATYNDTSKTYEIGDATALYAKLVPVATGGTAPTITTTSLPGGTVGTAYSQTLAATGTTPISWSVTTGSLPAGLSLNSSTGVISGTPTTAGTSTFSVTATNSAGASTPVQLSITIVAPAAHPLFFGQNGGTWNLYTDAALTTPYTENTSTWAVNGNTLTLNGFNFASTSANALTIVDDASMVLSGSNAITSAYSGTTSTTGILLEANLAVGGTGSLATAGGSNNANSVVTAGIAAGDTESLTVTGGKVTATGGIAAGATGYSLGLCVKTITVSGRGDVTAIAGTTATLNRSRGVYYANAGQIKVTGTNAVLRAKGNFEAIYSENKPVANFVRGTADGSTTNMVGLTWDSGFWSYLTGEGQIALYAELRNRSGNNSGSTSSGGSTDDATAIAIATSPQTGDNAGTGLWITLLALSLGAVVAGALIFRKKKKLIQTEEQE